jgi:hypothetical protein
LYVKFFMPTEFVFCMLILYANSVCYRIVCLLLFTFQSPKIDA